MTKKTKLLVIALAIAAVVIVSLVATVIIMSMGNKPATVQPKEDPIPSSTSDSNTNVSSVPSEDQNPASSIPESTPSVPPDNSQVAEAVPIDEYPGVFPLNQWGDPILPFYQEGKSIIAYAESLGFSQYIEDGVDENSADLSFYIGGSSYDSPDVRVKVNYRRHPFKYISVVFNYADGESSTALQILMEDYPEWVGGYDDFPDELAERLAAFLLSARGGVYQNTSGGLIGITRRDYESYYIRHNTDGVITEEEENWS